MGFLPAVQAEFTVVEEFSADSVRQEDGFGNTRRGFGHRNDATKRARALTVPVPLIGLMCYTDRKCDTGAEVDDEGDERS